MSTNIPSFGTVNSPLQSGGVYGIYPNPVNASDGSTSQVPVDRITFCEWRCNYFFWGCCCSLLGLLTFCFLIGLFIPAFGLLASAVAPSVVILLFIQNFYKDCVTQGQMTVSFLEAVLWMVPLIVWDIVWLITIQPLLGESGLCPTCVLGYFLNSYFVAGFCEELLKYCAVSRLQNSLLTPDYRCMMVYGACAGAGFATVENILYVISSDFATALTRAFTAVPLHCLTGSLIGLGLSKQRCLGIPCPFWKVILVPWLLHGTYDFVLTMGESADEFSTAAPFVWLFVYLGGLIYGRWEAMEFARACPLSTNIHAVITQGNPPIIGERRISQIGNSTNGVCDCCFMCACCCTSKRPESMQTNV